MSPQRSGWDVLVEVLGWLSLALGPLESIVSALAQVQAPVSPWVFILAGATIHALRIALPALQSPASAHNLGAVALVVLGAVTSTLTVYTQPDAQLVQPAGPGAPPAVTPADVPPVDPPPADAWSDPAPGPVSVILGMGRVAAVVVSAVVPAGCTGAQVRQGWGLLEDAARSCGTPALGAVIEYREKGEAIDGAAIGWEALPCVVGWLLDHGAQIVATVTGSEGVEALDRGPYPVRRDTPLPSLCGSREGIPTCRLLVTPPPVD